MSFVRELIDENIQKEMAEAVRDLEANVSNISVWMYIRRHTVRQDHMWQHMYIDSDISFLFRSLVVVQAVKESITNDL